MSYENEHKPPECTYAPESIPTEEIKHTEKFYIVENIPDSFTNNRHRYWVCSAHVQLYKQYPHLYKVED